MTKSVSYRPKKDARVIVPARKSPPSGSTSYAMTEQWSPDVTDIEVGHRSHSASLMLVITMATLGVLAYAAFLLNPANRGDWVPYIMVIVAEAILVSNALLSMWTMLASNHNPRDFNYYYAAARLFDMPSVLRDYNGLQAERWPIHLDGRPVVVEVFITTYGEPVETVRKTLTAALALQGRHRTWLLDDGHSDEMRTLAGQLGARYVRRLSSGGAKAGNVNHALTLAKGEFFVIFDADFVPRPNFLIETMPFFADPEVAFVQTPQAYGNMNNIVSRGAGYMQTVFYQLIQPGRNRFNAAFCVGTNVAFRREAIQSVGGMYTGSKSEDVWTSLMLHEKGWRSVYIPTVLAIGDTPETIEAFTKQQRRWATGGFEIMFTHNPLNPKYNLTLDQRLQYLVTSGFYLTGLAPGILLLIPPMHIFLDLTPVNLTITPQTWLMYYLGFYGLQVMIAYVTLGSFRWETLMLAAVSFPIYLGALRNALSGKEQKWHVTGASGKSNSPFAFIIPQVLVFAFLLLTSMVGVWKAWMTSNIDLALAWNVTNTLVIGVFIFTAFRELRRLRPGKGPQSAEDSAGHEVASSELEDLLATERETLFLAVRGDRSPEKADRLRFREPARNGRVTQTRTIEHLEESS